MLLFALRGAWDTGKSSGSLASEHVTNPTSTPDQTRCLDVGAIHPSAQGRGSPFSSARDCHPVLSGYVGIFLQVGRNGVRVSVGPYHFGRFRLLVGSVNAYRPNELRGVLCKFHSKLIRVSQ